MERDGLFIPGNRKCNETEWLVDGFVPFGGYCLIAAQPGVGKSWILESLAVNTVYEESFLGMEVSGGDVLLIDEDTVPASKAEERLNWLCSRFNGEPRHKLFTMIGEGFRIAGGDTNSIKSLVRRAAYRNVRLIVIDSLAAVVGGKSNLDNTKEAGAIVEFLQEISGTDRTVVVAHHISPKKSLSVDDAMSCENPDSLVMDHTRLISASTALYVLASPTRGDALENLFIRPVSRRVMLPKPFIAKFHNNNMIAYFEHGGDVMKEDSQLNKSDKAILSHMNPSGGLEGEYSVKMLSEKMADLIHINTIRSRLDILEDSKYVVMPRRGSSGMHMYKLAAKGIQYYCQHVLPSATEDE